MVTGPVKRRRSRDRRSIGRAARPPGLDRPARSERPPCAHLHRVGSEGSILHRSCRSRRFPCDSARMLGPGRAVSLLFDVTGGTIGTCSPVSASSPVIFVGDAATTSFSMIAILDTSCYSPRLARAYALRPSVTDSPADCGETEQTGETDSTISIRHASAERFPRARMMRLPSTMRPAWRRIHHPNLRRFISLRSPATSCSTSRSATLSSPKNVVCRTASRTMAGVVPKIEYQASIKRARASRSGSSVIASNTDAVGSACPSQSNGCRHRSDQSP